MVGYCVLDICRNQRARKVVKQEKLNKEQNVYIENILSNKLRDRAQESS